MVEAGIKAYQPIKNHVRDKLLALKDLADYRLIVLPDYLLSPFIKYMEGYLLTGYGYGRKVVRDRTLKLPEPAAFASVKYEPLDPEAAIEYFENKTMATHGDWLALSEKARKRATYVAGLEDKFFADVVKEKLDAAIAEGLTLADFKAGIEDYFKSDFHAETVFRTNVATAYEAGRWQELHNPETAKYYPAFTYHTMGDDAVRDEHAELDGLTYASDDPVWDTYWPPWDFNCRCDVEAVYVDDFDGEVDEPYQDLDLPEPDEGWGGNPMDAFEGE